MRVQLLGLYTIGALIASPSWGLSSGMDAGGAPTLHVLPHAAQPSQTRLAKKAQGKKKAQKRKETKAADGNEAATDGGGADTFEPASAPLPEAEAKTSAPSPEEATTTEAPATSISTSTDTANPLNSQASPAASEARVEAKGLDARVRRLTDALARSLKRLPGDIREQTFAVMPFQESGDDTANHQLGLVVADLVVTNLARDHRLQLTERSQLNRIVAEQELGALGFVEPEQAARIGALAGATALVLGEILDLGEAFQVGARVVDASSGQVLAVEAMELPKAELIAFSADAVVLRSRSGAFFRSLVVPGWGQSYNRETGKAVLVGATVGALILGSAGTGLSAWLTERSYRGFADEEREAVIQKGLNPSSVVEELRVSANTQYSIAAGLAGAVALVWLGNAVEAYLSGVDVENLDAALADR